MNLSVNIAGVEWKNPVTTASGTFGSGMEYAEYVDLNPNYLSGLFKSETGQTISHYINEQRMTAAKNMLVYSDTSIAEIACILSFNTQSHFTKVFRQTYGITPMECRKKYYRIGFEQGPLGSGFDTLGGK